MTEPVLSVRDLTATFELPDGPVDAVRGVSFDLAEGETLGIVGDSGAGKTSAMLALAGLLVGPPTCQVTGTVLHAGTELLTAEPATLRQLRADAFGFAFQDAQGALDPLARVGAQIAENVARTEPGLSRAELRERSIDWLRTVGVPRPELRVDQFPQQFSRGMAKRAMLAMAMAHEPTVLVADDPTTGLDPVGRADMLRLLGARRQAGLATVILSRNREVVAEHVDRILTMSDGRLRSADHDTDAGDPGRLSPSPARDAVDRASQPRGERGEQDTAISMPREVLRVEALDVHFPVRKGLWQKKVDVVRAVDDVDLTLCAGEVLGLVGESPSGRSVLGRAVTRLLEPTSGRILLAGEDIASSSRRRLRDVHPRARHLEGSPSASIDLDKTVQELLQEPLDQSGVRGKRARIAELVELIGLSSADADRRARELSPADRELVGIASVLVTRPAVLVLDEPTADLDDRVRDRVVEVLQVVPTALDVGVLLITHDDEVIRRLADRVAVMHEGRILEMRMG